jgi:hypothetical protein
MKKIAFNEICNATWYCERYLYYKDLDEVFKKWRVKEIKKYSNEEDFNRNLKIIEYFISEPYDLFSRKYIGLSPGDSVCGSSVPVSDRLKYIIKKMNL